MNKLLFWLTQLMLLSSKSQCEIKEASFDVEKMKEEEPVEVTEAKKDPASSNSKVECTKLDPKLQYSQDKAPKEISFITDEIIEKLNLKNIKSVEVLYTGYDIHKKVGEHTVEVLVSSETKECFEVKFEILDVNECTLTKSHVMRHLCHESSICVNTIGGYECLCPLMNSKSANVLNGTEQRSMSEVSLASSSCPFKKSTLDCCEKDAHSSSGQKCRSEFICPTDACASLTCGKNEICSIVNKKPKCQCAPGYIKHETHGCVDKRPPKLQLRNDLHKNSTTILTQGTFYHEYSVTIQDENVEEDMRRLKITYSDSILSKCLQVGNYHVNYTLATPWTSPPYAKVTRYIEVVDLDECALSNAQITDLQKKGCHSLIPQCVPEATCKNTIGSYECHCPHKTSGDGFLNGTRCVDTSIPELTLHGPKIKVFHTSASLQLDSVLSTQESLIAKSNKWDMYENMINTLIEETNGLELCATHDETPKACATAVDVTYNDTIDLSSRIQISKLQRIQIEQGYQWKVIYSVKDDAGNLAEAFRFIQLIEVNSWKEIEAIIQKKIGNTDNSQARKSQCQAAKPCPKCNIPKCPNCPVCKQCETSSPSSCDSVEQLNQFIAHTYHFFPTMRQQSLILAILIAFFILIVYLWQCIKPAPTAVEQQLHGSVVYYTSPDGRVAETPSVNRRAFTPQTATSPPPTRTFMTPAGFTTNAATPNSNFHATPNSTFQGDIFQR